MWTALDWSEVGKLAAWVLATAGASFVGSYFGAYLKKKGENLATQEDIDKVVDQVRAVTRTTKEIESKISGELWDRQKQWDLRREAFFGLARSSTALRKCIADFREIEGCRKAYTEKPELRLKLEEARQRYFTARTAFDEAHSVAALLWGMRMESAVDEFRVFVADILDHPEKDEDGREFVAQWTKVVIAMRYELGIDFLTPQSNESLATPIPG